MNEPRPDTTGRGNGPRGPIAWMAQNAIAANLAMVILLGGGVWTALTMQKEVFPQFALDIVQVQVAYPGASPAEVEQGILMPVEEAARGVQGIKEITAAAREGSGSVQFELVAGIDRIKTYQDIDQAIAQIRTFPDNAEEPEVRLQEQQTEVMEIALYGDAEIWILRQLAERVRDQLLNKESITQVAIGNVPEFVTHIEIPHDRLREYGLTLGQVADIVESSARDIPAGSVNTSRGEILLRMNERKQWAEQFSQIVVVSSDSGASVTLGDIATITDGFEETGFHGQFNRQPSVELEISRIGKQSPLEVASAVREVIDEFDQTLPPGIKWRIDSNAAKDFDDRLSLLVENGALAVIIIIVILSLFLEYRLSFWIMMGMAISFIGAINFLPALGVSINMISMFGFLVALGIVVDDAIVVGENVYEYRERGMGTLEAAIEGARNIAWPVTFSILTNIVAFLPILFVPGVVGKFWWAIPVVVISVLVLSLLEALFILPAHLGHVGKRKRSELATKIHGWQHAFSRRVSETINNSYRPFLGTCLRHRYVTLTSAVVLLGVTAAYAWSDHMGMIVMPEVAADEIEAGVRLPAGTTIDQAATVATDITNETHALFEEHNLFEVAEGIKTNVRGQNFIDVEIVMKPRAERDMSSKEVIELWRAQIGDIKGVDQITFETERGPGGWQDDISVDLSHSDIAVLARASEELFQRMEEFENTTGVNDSYETGKTQLNFKLRPEGRALGLTPADVGAQVRGAFYGALSLRFLRGTNEVEVRVKLPESERESLRYVEDFIVRTPDGVEVPLGEVAEVETGASFAQIDRRDGRRVITVGTDVEPKSRAGSVREAINAEILPQLRTDYPGLTWSFEGSQAEMRESTAALWGGFGLALGVIYTLLAIAFSSYIQPLIVMMAIPFGVVGAVLGHIIMGYELSLVSMMGVVAVSGVVVNGALIMVHYANRKRQDTTPQDAIHQAGVRRFRPILLTTLTTFGGLTPIIMETSPQAQYLIPMAISLGFGIVFATAITLVVVPCLYMMLEDIKGLASN